MPVPSRRTETRTPMSVPVDLSSLDARMPAQQGITENVSPRGARVVTARPWQLNARLNVRSLHGSLRSRCRVAYCQSLAQETYAIGLELFAPAGDWASPSPVGRP